MTLQIHDDVEQGTPEWHALRRGLPTASTIGQLITPKTIKPADNDYSRALTAQLVAERLTGHTEDTYPSRDMEQGHLDEPYARDIYSRHYAPVDEVGFMTSEIDGHRIGFSPDGLVGVDGLIEIKSRRQKKQLATILTDEVPLENMAQIQCGLLVSGRDWCDYISYCGGMPLYVKRVHPDPRWHEAIRAALNSFEQNAAQMIATYTERTNGAPITERIDHFAVIEIAL